MKKLSAIPLILLVLSLKPLDSAYALSCVAPAMNESVVEAAAIIFEGVANRGRDLSRAERATLKAAGVTPLGGGVGDLKVFEFTVTKGWKGAVEGQRIQVLRNTYWGDSFAAAGTYLVVGERVGDGLHLAPLCGNTVHLEYAQDSGHLKTLEGLIGGGAQAQ
jgi:hypothetical protein